MYHVIIYGRPDEFVMKLIVAALSSSSAGTSTSFLQTIKMWP